MSQPHRNLPFLLLKTRENLMAYFRPILNEHNITEQQWRIIRTLHEYGDLEPRQLCEYCLILSPSMAGILKRMEEVGLIQKIPMTDQRRISIRLTNEAHERYDQILKKSNATYQSLENKIGSKTMIEVYAILDAVNDKL